MKSSSEEVIKIPLSYRIIKNNAIECHEEEVSVIETRSNIISITNYEETVHNQEPWDYSKEKEEIRKELMEEINRQNEKNLEEIYKEIENYKETLYNEAYEKGYQNGLGKGYEDAIEKAEEESNRLKNNGVRIIEQAQKEITEYFTENRRNIIQLSLDMAENIIHEKIDSTSQNIMLLIKPILQQFGKRESIIITCHSDNLEFVKNNISELEEICPGTKIFVLENNNLEKNGCVIENEHQIIDLQIKKQLLNMKEMIMQME